ncbi:MAG: hypothetical protein IPK95_05275 [Cellvibrionales bacterium]|nr:hypothetical protein [Cellvibrionales bacterium]
MKIERIDGPNQPRHLVAERVDKALAGAAMFIARVCGFVCALDGRFSPASQHIATLQPDVALAAGGDPNIAYYHGYFHWLMMKLW